MGHVVLVWNGERYCMDGPSRYEVIWIHFNSCFILFKVTILFAHLGIYHLRYNLSLTLALSWNNAEKLSLAWVANGHLFLTVGAGLITSSGRFSLRYTQLLCSLSRNWSSLNGRSVVFCLKVCMSLVTAVIIHACYLSHQRLFAFYLAMLLAYSSSS